MKKTLPSPKTARSIPPPPDLEDGYDAIIAYHEKYGIDELVQAGHLEEVPLEEQREVKASAAFQLLCKFGLQVKLSRRDCQRLAELAASKDQDVETLVKGWVKEHLGPTNGTLGNGAMRKTAGSAKHA